MEYLDQLFALYEGLEQEDYRRKHIFFELFKKISLYSFTFSLLSIGN